MKRTLLAALIASSGILAAVVGCNAILGNEAGMLASSDASIGTDAPVVTGDSGPITPTDAGGCAMGQKECGGVCVNVTDPSVGCGGECNPCTQLANGSTKCGLSDDTWVCTLGDCTAGYADCDKQPADGCESSLNGKHSCGTCAMDCVDGGHAFCQPATTTTEAMCTDVCNAPNTNCCGNSLCPGAPNDTTGDCVDLTGDPSNCGGCGHSCMAQFPNANIACASSTCSITSCMTGFAKCSNACVADTNKKCGASCTDCTASGKMCESSTGTCVAANCTGTKIFCPAVDSTQCIDQSNSHCGPSCAACAGGTHCVAATGMCVADPPTCVAPKIPCPAGCTSSCTNGCIDPTLSPTCGGDCQAGNDCTQAGSPQACCPNGAASSGYVCTDYDAGDDDSGPPPANCNP